MTIKHSTQEELEALSLEIDALDTEINTEESARLSRMYEIAEGMVQDEQKINDLAEKIEKEESPKLDAITWKALNELETADPDGI
jgi:hypothetical protein